MEGDDKQAKKEKKTRVPKVKRKLKAALNMYTVMMPVEQVPDLMDPRYTKKADF